MVDLSHAIRTEATPQAVYDAITTREGLRGWHVPQVSGDPSPGGIVTFDYKSHDRFVWRVDGSGPTGPGTWVCLEGPDTAPDTTITFTLGTKDTRTHVSCVHRGLPEDRPDVAATCNTLLGIMLGRLRDYAATHQAEPAFS